MLREQATDIGRMASSIPGISSNSIRQTIDNLRFASLELRRVGVDFSNQFNARFKRIQFENDLNAARGNIKTSNRLFESDRYMRRNPGRYETATQRISAVDRLKELTRPFASKMERYREIYGGDADIIQRAEADEAYRAHIKSIRDPIGLRRDALKEKFGGGARGNILAINAMRAEADEAYRKDMLSDFDSRMEDLTERYGGDRNKAENKYKKELSQNLPLFFRNSKMSAKQLSNLTKGYSFVKSAGTTGISIATAAIATTKGITKAADSGNARVVGMENLMNLYGKPSKDVLSAGLLAGMKPEDVVKIRGQMLTKFGGMKPLMGIAKNISTLDDRSRVAVAEQLGLDANMIAFLDILTQTGRIKDTEHRQTNAKTELAKYTEAELLKSGSGFWNTIIGYFGDASVGARSIGDIKIKGDKAKEISERSSSLPSQGMVAPESSTSQSGAQVSINIGTVDVNADNPEQFAYGLAAEASSHSKNHTLAVAFDSGIKA